jgi:hypothetical protein
MSEYLTDLISAYEHALDEKDFITMTDLAGLALQTLSETYKASKFVYFLDPSGKCPDCYGEDGTHTDSQLIEWAFCHYHKAKWIIGYEGQGPRSIIVEQKDNIEKLKAYKEVRPVHILQENRKISLSSLANSYRNSEDSSDR